VPPMPKKKTPTRTFTMPESDSEVIKEIQKRCYAHGMSLHDCEVVRAGIASLMDLPDKKFLQVVNSIVRLRRGRPPQGDE
jgi:hypothetical protein